MDPGVASELDLVILDPEWSGSGRTGAPGAVPLHTGSSHIPENSCFIPEQIVFKKE